MTTSIIVSMQEACPKTHREFGKVGPHPLPTSLLELYSDPMFGRALKKSSSHRRSSSTGSKWRSTKSNLILEETEIVNPSQKVGQEDQVH